MDWGESGIDKKGFGFFVCLGGLGFFLGGVFGLFGFFFGGFWGFFSGF